MEFFKAKSNIDFMGLRKTTAIFSMLIIIASLAILAVRGINLGLDFTGGTQLEIRYAEAPEISNIRELLAASNYGEAKVQTFGTTQDILIRLHKKEGESEKTIAENVVKVLQAADPNVELRQVQFVGSEVGEKLFEQGGLAILVSLLATMLYIAMRFEYRFAVSSAVALIHDPILILGIFSFFRIEFDLPTLAGMLAIIGYSLNDTIVVFDRVRENFRTIRKADAISIMNLSINQTLSRTIMTSGLTLLVVAALLVFGGDSLFGFSLALLIGILVGTYSSIYVAGALAIAMGLSRGDLLPTPTAEVDEVP